MNVEAKIDNYSPTMISAEEKAVHGWDVVSFNERMTSRLNKMRLLSAENDEANVRTSDKEYIRQ